MTQKICVWREKKDKQTGRLVQWELMVRYQRGHRSCAAIVWPNGTWHTFDRFGTGGENDVEATVSRAKIEAAASAIEQGFI